jgi:penicillin-binding protein 2
VLKIDTGEVVSSVSYPAFDPNRFTETLKQEQWNKLTKNRYKPLLNRPLVGLYAPGSTLKMGVLLAALESNMVTWEDQVLCREALKFGKDAFHCWRHKYGGHGSVSAYRALVESCDAYFYDLAMRINIQDVVKILILLGFERGDYSTFPESRFGILPTPSWKKETFKRPWTKGDTILTLIGQGFCLNTPLELAVMIARLASGKMVSPTLYYQREVPSFQELPFRKEHLDVLREALSDVVNKPQGLAFRWRLKQKDFLMAGKTGTSQVRRISLEERRQGVVKNEDLPWERRDHGLFVGYAPTHNPKYALSIVIEHGGSGGVAAAPLAKKIFTFLKNAPL